VGNVKKSIKQYIIVPGPSPLTGAVERFLWLHNWTEVPMDEADKASLVVLGPEFDGDFLDAEMLGFYNCGLGGCRKAVLSLSSERQRQGMASAPWFQVLNPTLLGVFDVLAWLDEYASQPRIDCKQKALSPDICRTLLSKSLKVDSDLLDNTEALAPLLGESTASLVADVMRSSSLAVFFYHLCQMSIDHSDYDHDTLRVLDNPWSYSALRETTMEVITPTQPDPRLLRAMFERPFRTACEGLRLSLCSMAAERDPEKEFSLLLVDDGFKEFKPEFLAVLKYLLPANSSLYEWNPLSNDHQREAFREICSYKSLKHRSLQDEGILVKPYRDFSRDAVDTENSGEEEKTLLRLLTEADFVLVDQLFKFTGSSGELRGPEFIRGLSRLMRDMISDESLERLDRPELIALSRTPSPEQIQLALFAGARAYLLKSNLLELPSILRQVQTTASRADSDLHQNLRALEFLPNETRSLLESIRIPRIPVHRDIQSAKRELPEYNPKHLQGFSQLIRSLPKTDLHVHVGSCMSREFLVIGSLVSLLRYEHKVIEPLLTASRDFFSRLCLDEEKPCEFTVTLRDVLCCGPNEDHKARTIKVKVTDSSKWTLGLGEEAKEYLAQQCLAGEDDDVDSYRYEKFRSVLHQGLGIRDRLDPEQSEEKIKDLPTLDVVLFTLMYSDPFHKLPTKLLTRDNLVRVYLLTLAAQNEKNRLNPNDRYPEVDLLNLFRKGGVENAKDAWNHLHDFFYSAESESSTSEDSRNRMTVSGFRQRGWRLPAVSEPPFKLCFDEIGGGKVNSNDWSPDTTNFYVDPIKRSLATGLRSKNLIEYLEGCEFSGAEHLRHPYLMHLYAQQCLVDFIRQGVFYAELRGSPDGYINSDAGFEFTDACQCFTEAFSQAQETTLRAYKQQPEMPGWIAGILSHAAYDSDSIRAMFKDANRSNDTDIQVNDDVLCARLPCKVSIVFVGKRHKPSRQMILEAAAAAVSRPSGKKPILTARRFVESELSKCRVVGFDLAGKEVDNPPTQFVEEFERLSRLHIPLTVHAGENESAQFIEDSILGLGAHRLGHGLSLVEDSGLLARVREDRICVELCPVSNHQTSYFGDPDDESTRQYPLRRFLKEGVLVCINTDNPVISSTNMVREFFQASYSYGGDGLSLWDALRLIRFGFVSSFLTLSERRAMLELVSQHMYDLLTDPDVVNLLRDLKRNSVTVR